MDFDDDSDDILFIDSRRRNIFSSVNDNLNEQLTFSQQLDFLQRQLEENDFLYESFLLS